MLHLFKAMVEKIKRPFKKDVYFECKWITKSSFEKEIKKRGISVESVAAY